MKMWKRLSLCILAWLISHFILYMGFTFATNNPPGGLIALIDMCVALLVFYLTGKKNGVKIETINKNYSNASKTIEDHYISQITTCRRCDQGFQMLASTNELHPICPQCLDFLQKAKKNKNYDTKKCPLCAETIKKEAKICKHCGNEVQDEIKYDKVNEMTTIVQEEEVFSKTKTIDEVFKDFQSKEEIVLFCKKTLDLLGNQLSGENETQEEKMGNIKTIDDIFKECKTEEEIIVCCENVLASLGYRLSGAKEKWIVYLPNGTGKAYIYSLEDLKNKVVYYTNMSQ